MLQSNNVIFFLNDISWFKSEQLKSGIEKVCITPLTAFFLPHQVIFCKINVAHWHLCKQTSIYLEMAQDLHWSPEIVKKEKNQRIRCSAQSIGTNPTSSCLALSNTFLAQFCNQLKNSKFWSQERLSAVINIVKLNTSIRNPKLCSDCNFFFNAHSYIFISLCLVLIACIKLWYWVQQTKCLHLNIRAVSNSIKKKKKLQTSLGVQLYIFSFTQVVSADFSGTPHRVKNVLACILWVTMILTHLKCRLGI